MIRVTGCRWSLLVVTRPLLVLDSSTHGSRQGRAEYAASQILSRRKARYEKFRKRLSKLYSNLKKMTTDGGDETDETDFTSNQDAEKL